MWGKQGGTAGMKLVPMGRAFSYPFRYAAAPDAYSSENAGGKGGCFNQSDQWVLSDRTGAISGHFDEDNGLSHKSRPTEIEQESNV